MEELPLLTLHLWNPIPTEPVFRRSHRAAENAKQRPQVPLPSIEQTASWRARRLALETEEPGVWEWLNRRCYREEGKARGVAKDEIERHLAGA